MSTRDYYIKNFDAMKQPNGSYVDNVDVITWYNSEGARHREDGPAVIFYNKVRWYYNGIPYNTFDEWLMHSTISDEDKMLMRLQYA